MNRVNGRAALILLSLPLLSCRPDAPGEASASASATAGASGRARGCADLAEHWREVWAAETPSGLMRRRAYVVTRVVTMWGAACGSIAKEPAQDLPPVIEELR